MDLASPKSVRNLTDLRGIVYWLFTLTVWISPKEYLQNIKL